MKDYQTMYTDQLKQILQPQPPANTFRVAMRAPGVIALKRNQGMTDGVMLYEGYNQLLLAKRHPEVNDVKKMYDMLGIKSFSQSPNGHYLSIGYYDQTIRLYNHISWKEIILLAINSSGDKT